MSRTVSRYSAALLATCTSVMVVAQETPHPILFVTQVPIPQDFATIGSVFGNHKASIATVGRGGDLWIRYPEGQLKNVTASAGFGNDGFQGSNAIAVRDPSAHWDGTKAVFSMVVGAPAEQYQLGTYRWQLYEVTNLGIDETPVITRVSNQPQGYNNISPIYGSDDRIIFTSDRPFNGSEHLYPQLDEYEETPVVTGLWSLEPATGDLFLLNHSPSGDFTPMLDSFGRVIFTQWDHLQRDQQADGDALTPKGEPEPYGTFNYSDEGPASVPLFGERTEVFPEPRPVRTDLLQGTNLVGHRFNHFLPWQCNEDGTEVETLNHIGRHELHDYLPATINDDPNVIEYYGQYPRYNPNSILNLLQVEEDPTLPGRYVGVDAPEFQTHAAGQVVSQYAPPQLNADQIEITYLTHPDTASPSNNPGPEHSGLSRDPCPLSDGNLVITHTDETRADQNDGSTAQPQSRYDFRLKMLFDAGGDYMAPGASLTGGIAKTVSYWNPDDLVTYSGFLWEWQAVELRARPRPERRFASLPQVEQNVFDQVGVNVDQLRCYMIEQDLALIVSRDVTTRDDADVQQPFNLRVAGTNTETVGAEGTMYDVSAMQIYQADLLRGLTYGSDTPRPGRRVLAQPMHDAAAMSANGGTIAESSTINIADDGSFAAFVPARRALAWQLLAPDQTPVVRERNWLTFQPGEIRVCASCHGVNEFDQAGFGEPVNPPAALQNLLLQWMAQNPALTDSAPDCDQGDELPDYVDVHTCLVENSSGKLPIGCASVDFDHNHHIDLRDFGIFQVLYTGP